MIAIGNNELGAPVENDEIVCPHCGKTHQLEYGTSRMLMPDRTWSEPVVSKTTGFYKCEGQLYLGSINGRAVRLQKQGEGE